MWLEKWLKELKKKNQKDGKKLKKLLLDLIGFKGESALLLQKDAFFQSRAWQKIRYEAIVKHGRQCQACGRKDQEIHVDHIQPRSKFPKLALEISNLQVLCRDCNLGKGNWNATDWRKRN
jgi:hypothetical protein